MSSSYYAPPPVKRDVIWQMDWNALGLDIAINDEQQNGQSRYVCVKCQTGTNDPNCVAGHYCKPTLNYERRVAAFSRTKLLLPKIHQVQEPARPSIETHRYADRQWAQNRRDSPWQDPRYTARSSCQHFFNADQKPASRDRKTCGGVCRNSLLPSQRKDWPEYRQAEFTQRMNYIKAQKKPPRRSEQEEP